MNDTTLFAGQYETTGFMVLLLFFVIIPVGLTLLSAIAWIRHRFFGRRRHKRLLYAALAADLFTLACTADAWLIEPRMLTVARVSIESPKVSEEIKLMHISDVHFIQETPLTEKVVEVVEEERPDILLLTGDLADMKWHNTEEFASFMRRLCLATPTYFVQGADSPQEIVLASGNSVNVTSHIPTELPVGGTLVRIIGLGEANFKPSEPRPISPGALNIMLNHTPDLIDHAAWLGADLYFAGHTHGGQVRVPFWGAVVTNSGTGKRYEYGLYKVDQMSAFVTRGVGMEVKLAPRVRFLCPPEVVVVTVK
ncbi:MAG: metallophosphoesterase [Armatimonadota bacterium]